MTSLLAMRVQYLRMLQEVGDLESVEPYSFEDGSFVTKQGWKVNVDMEALTTAERELFNIPADGKAFNVSYKVEGIQSQYKKTSYKQLIKILKTVSDVITGLVEKNPGTVALVFLAANKDDSKLLVQTDPQKSAIYKTILVKNISKLGLGWKLRDIEMKGSGFTGFILIKTEIQKITHTNFNIVKEIICQ